jgi:hypothetical protein
VAVALVAFALLMVLATGCVGEPCVPADLGAPVPEGEARLYAWWTDNAFPLELVVDDTAGCPLELVQAGADYWAPYSGGFRVVRGRWKGGSDRAYAHVYLRAGTPPHGWSGHTQLAAIEPGRAMYASITVARCDLAIITHELGHALGLDEAGREGAVMQPREDLDGWDLSAAEADRLAYACSAQ